jgi:hypothetical protein
MKRKNIIYIIGAGASKDYGLPLGDEIFEYAYKFPLIKNSIFNQELKNALNNVENIMRQLFLNLPDNRLKYPPFEEVLTFIWDTKKTEYFDYKSDKLISIFGENKSASDVLSSCITLLLLTISGCMNYKLSMNRLKIYKQYIKSLDFNNNDITFISFNYDLIIDNILEECVDEQIINDFTYNIPLADATIILPYHNQNRVYIKEKGVLLLKPHGSINLVYCERHKQATYGEGYFWFKNIDSILNNLGIKCPSCGNKTKPLIIPPLYNKKDYITDTKPKTDRIVQRSTPDNYRDYIDKSIKEVLSRADEINIIGYSLPSYDYDFRSLLIAGLMSNKKRDQVHLKIITKCPSEMQKLLKQQYKYIVGKVTIEGDKGFYNYLLQKMKS